MGVAMTMKIFEDITLDEFESYEDVRTSGLTNMFLLSNVEEMSGLDRETLIVIMKYYEKLLQKYPGVVK